MDAGSGRIKFCHCLYFKSAVILMNVGMTADASLEKTVTFRC